MTKNESPTRYIGDGVYAIFDGFKSESSKLYVTKKGRFFLCGRGGPMTRWAEAVPTGGWNEGSGILAITKWEALSLAESWCDDDDIIAEYFEIEDA